MYIFVRFVTVSALICAELTSIAIVIEIISFVKYSAVSINTVMINKSPKHGKMISMCKG